MWFFGGNRKGKFITVFDIGSSSVGGAIIFISNDKNNKPKIITSVRTQIQWQDNLDFSRFVILMEKALSNTAKELSNKKLPKPSRIFCFLSSPWYISATRVVKMTRDTPFIFTKKLWYEMIEKEIADFRKKELPKYENNGEQPIVIEKYNISVSLNGYITSNPIGKKINSAEISLFISMSPKEIIESIKDKIQKYFNISNFNFSSFLFASFMSMRDVFAKEENFIIVDITGELTDVGLVKKESFIESASFPMGRNFVIRRVASFLNETEEIALSHIKMFLSGNLESSESEKIKKALDKVRVDWLKSFQLILVGMSEDLSLPSTVFMTADDDIAKWFLNTIKTEEFNQYVFTEKEFNVIMILPQTVDSFVESKDSKADQFLILETIFINKLLKN